VYTKDRIEYVYVCRCEKCGDDDDDDVCVWG
jgi:hypothetical protein